MFGKTRVGYEALPNSLAVAEIFSVFDDTDLVVFMDLLVKHSAKYIRPFACSLHTANCSDERGCMLTYIWFVPRFIIPVLL